MTYLMQNEFINFIKENGREILKKPVSFEASLLDYCSTKLTSNVYKAEAFILSEALREGIIQELLEVKSVNDTLIRKLSKQLQATCGFTAYASDGAIDTWCYALGLKDVPVEKVEEARVDESSSRNDKNIYIANESYFYGIKNFIILFGLLNLFVVWSIYDNFKSNSYIDLVFDFSFLVFGIYILYWAINKRIEILKFIKYYLFFRLPIGLIQTELGVQFGSTTLDVSRLYVYITSIAFGLLEIYVLFRYFSKSDRIKATFGQYLVLDKFLLVIKNVGYNEYLRLNQTKVAPIKLNLMSSFEKSGRNDLLFGVLIFLGAFIIPIILAFENKPNPVANKFFISLAAGLIGIGIGLFIRGIIRMSKSRSTTVNSFGQSEKTNTESSTNTNYSQKAESTNTSYSANADYTKQSENFKQQSADADYNKQTSNQSTKKEEQPKKEKTFEDRLEELKRLHEKGIITEAEFQTRKTEILKEL